MQFAPVNITVNAVVKRNDGTVEKIGAIKLSKDLNDKSTTDTIESQSS
jgi:hypothetical protein